MFFDPEMCTRQVSCDKGPNCRVVVALFIHAPIAGMMKGNLWLLAALGVGFITIAEQIQAYSALDYIGCYGRRLDADKPPAGGMFSKENSPEK